MCMMLGRTTHELWTCILTVAVSSNTPWFTRGQGARLGEANASGGDRVCKSFPLLSCKSIIASLRQEREVVLLHMNCTKTLIKGGKFFHLCRN